MRKYGAKTFLLEKRHHKFEPTTYAETREQALEAGAGLAALGIRPGDKVAILAEGSNAWIISELGLFYAGAVSVPLSVICCLYLRSQIVTANIQLHYQIIETSYHSEIFLYFFLPAD